MRKQTTKAALKKLIPSSKYIPAKVIRTKSGAIKIKIETRHLKAVAKRAIKKVRKTVKRVVGKRANPDTYEDTKSRGDIRDWVWFYGKHYAARGNQPSKRWERLKESYGLVGSLRRSFMMGYKAGKASKRR